MCAQQIGSRIGWHYTCFISGQPGSTRAVTSPTRVRGRGVLQWSVRPDAVLPARPGRRRLKAGWTHANDDKSLSGPFVAVDPCLQCRPCTCAAGHQFLDRYGHRDRGRGDGTGDRCRQHRVDADFDSPGPDDGDPRTGVVLRGHGPQKERALGADAGLRHGVCGLPHLGGGRLLLGIHRRYAVDRRSRSGHVAGPQRRQPRGRLANCHRRRAVVFRDHPRNRSS